MTLANTVNRSNTTPAAPAGNVNNAWQDDGGSPTVDVSTYTPLMTGDAGAGGTAGSIPAPPAGSAAAGKFLKADGTFAVPPGSTGTFTPEAVTFSGTGGTLAHTPIVGAFFALFRNGVLMTTAGSGAIQTYSIIGAAITLSVTAGGDSFYALYYH
jgi:hypothetical protein